MRKQDLNHILSVSARILLAFAFVFGQTAWAGQSQDPKGRTSGNGSAKTQPQSQANPTPTPAAKAEPLEEENAVERSSAAEESSQRGGPHEGIKVHGHWTIEVRNADGTIAARHEFENSLSPVGGGVLSALLARKNAVGLWRVTLSSTTTAGVCSAPPAAPLAGSSACNIDEPNFELNAVPDPNESPNLTVSTSGGALTLSGSLVAPQTGVFNIVATQLEICPISLLSGNPGTGCAPAVSNISLPLGGTYPASYFTAATLDGLNGRPSAVSVAAGQTVAVTVNISFS